jgi:cytochrome c553
MSAPNPRRPTGRVILRWTVRVLVTVVALVLTAAGAVYGLSERRLHARFTPPSGHALDVRADAATIARGRHLTTTRGCVDCHGENLAGRVMLDDPMVGRLAGANLTAGRRGGALGDREWELAVRHGMRPDGSGLLVMPSQEFTGMSDEDLAAIVAYARTLPAVTEPPPASRAGPLIRALYVGGQVNLLAADEIDHAKPHLRRVDAAPTPAYGKYLAAGCTGCHGPGFSGGKIPGAPPDWGPAANLTPGGNVGRWSEAQFVHAIRTGQRPDGSRIDGKLMPLKILSQMEDVELRALYAYLRTVPAKEYGNR